MLVANGSVFVCDGARNPSYCSSFDAVLTWSPALSTKLVSGNSPDALPMVSTQPAVSATVSPAPICASPMNRKP